MRYEETIEYLFGLQKHGMKFGLDNIRRLLAAFGNPQNSFRCVHVAGTNGKGSTCATIESILRTSGAKTGLFTSPHLVSFTERIRVNGAEISENEVIGLAAEVRSVVEAMQDFHPTFFEVVTAIGFLHFQRAGVEWAVVEVGMGGRLDSTNVLIPEVSVITPVDVDHSEYLGSTLAEISREKAGIIKPNVPVVLSRQKPEALDVLLGSAQEKGAPAFCLGRDFAVEPDSSSDAFSYRGLDSYAGLVSGLKGGHQHMNAGTAIRTVEELCRANPDLRCDMRAGVAAVSWPGRFETVKQAPRVIIDGAHNPAAAETLAAELKRLPGGCRPVLVIGVMGDKDIRGILRPLLPLASGIVFASPAYGRSAPAGHLQKLASEMGFSSGTAASVAEAVAEAERLAGNSGLVVVTGSFYTIGEAKEALGHKGVLTRLRE
ncbi:MAG: folylpolyglutamate synthase/dihydrofolate synthase family protein [Thermodesulfovibrionales bacterium]